MSTRAKKDVSECGFLNVEIHICVLQNHAYPVEITLGSGERCGGSLSADILPWESSRDQVEDGQKLFNAVFSDEVRDVWYKAKGQSRQRRILLRIDAPELAPLPWELLREGNIILSASADTPFSRYLAVSEQQGDMIKSRPIQVLAIISNPAGLENSLSHLAPINVKEERDILERAFSGLNKRETQLDFFDPPVTLTRIAQYLQDHSGCHVIHYVGHGAFSRREEATLYLQDEDGNAKSVAGAKFVEMLARQPRQACPRLVFLAACQTAVPTTAAAFRGLGPYLIQTGIPAVVAMQDRVAVETARELTRIFYRHLTRHGTVDLALNQARHILLASERSDAAVPVLFMRLESGKLWEVEEKDLLMDIPEIVLIPVGPFWRGSPPGAPGAQPNEAPRLKLDVAAYRIGRYPVTNAQYACFLAANPDHPIPYSDDVKHHDYNWNPRTRNYPDGKAEHPVVLVNLEDAMAYCRWLSEMTGQPFRLPKEEEWEKAARGLCPDERDYPWGAWREGYCNTQELGRQRTSNVHEFERTNSSPFGVVDMAGNVWEWTSSRYIPYPGSTYAPSSSGGERNVVRGGSWANFREKARVSFRGRYVYDTRRPYLGFRVVCDVIPPSPSRQPQTGVTREMPAISPLPIKPQTPEVITPEISEEMIDPAKLRQRVEGLFASYELRLLCSDLKLPYDNLVDRKKSIFALNIVEHCERRERLVELVNYCQRKCSHVDWQSIVRKDSDK
ncbi:MAG TPA: CHAT domain-containing protein [Chloroflexi bacterium]|nr:CHAT domain-containing protein [Chloroflexota bacterium]